MSELAFRSIVDVSNNYRNGELSPVAVIDACLRRVEKFDSKLGAFQTMYAEDARKAAEAAEKLGIVTFIPDDIDWKDEVRLAIEERASYSTDALTGMEASLRFAGPETLETKIFGRLSAWQNWIFQRPNAVGEGGALNLFGTGKQAKYDKKRV